MRIAFVSVDSQLGEPGPDGHRRRLQSGSSWWRCEIPARYLRENGRHAVHYPRLRSDPATGEIVPVSWDGEADMSGFDIVVVLRWMSPSAAHEIRRARAGGQVIVSDCDDWFDGLDSGRIGAGAYFRGLDLADYRQSLLASSVLTVSTPYLAERLKALGRPTYVVRNAIDLDRWKRAVASRNGRPVVGWIGVTSWHPGDLETIAPVLGPFLRDHGFGFAHHGHAEHDRPAADLLGVPSELVERVRPMVTIDRYPDLFAGIDIGLVPLGDTDFNRAKCLDAATRVVCARRGNVPIGDIRRGDRVWSGSGWTAVKAVAHERPRAGYRLRSADGRQIAVSPEHRLRRAGGWARAEQLRVGDHLAVAPPPGQTVGESWHATANANASIEAIEPVAIRPVDLEVAGSVFAAEGLVSHNSAIKGMEYAAAGIPFVAQATPEYVWFDPSATARTAAEWTRALERLADPQSRDEHTRRQGERLNHLDAAVRWRDWEEAYADASR